MGVDRELWDCNARGKYFKLLGGDEYFNTRGLDELVETIKTTTVDCIYSPYVSFGERPKNIIARMSI